MSEELFPNASASESFTERNGLFFPDAEILLPTWDHAFKALFLDHRELTLRFVNDFFDFECPIIDLEFLSNDIEPKNHNGKSVRLDVALKLANGILVDLEMQTSFSAGYLRRCVFYNSMLLVSQTKSGALYKRQPSENTQTTDMFTVPADAKASPLTSQGFSTEFLPNVVSLTLLNDRLPQKSPQKFRHSYQLKDGDDYLDKDCFRIDVLELPKLREQLAQVPERQRIWVRFFLAQTYAEVKELCAEDSIIKRACEVLEVVSNEKEMRELARMIWQGEFAKRHEELLRQERELAFQERERAHQERERAHQERERAHQERERAHQERERAQAQAILETEARVESERRARIALEEQSVRALATTGQSPEEIAALLNLNPERVTEILASVK